MINKYFELLDGLAKRHAGNPRIDAIMVEQLIAFYDCGAEAKGIVREWKQSKQDAEPTCLAELRVALSNHDWLYAFSDDSRAYQRGRDQAQEIRHLMTICRDKGFGAEADTLYSENKVEVCYG